MLNIICEIANGYYGSLSMSKEYINLASKTGANAIKFQIAYAEEMLNRNDIIFPIIKKNEMSLNKWKKLREYANNKKLKFYLDIDGMQALDLAKKIKPDAIKIHTTSFFDKRLLLESLKRFKKVYISISGIEEVEFSKLYKFLKKTKKLNKVIFLHGHQNAPTKINDINLSRITSLKEKFKNLNIGFMDHISGSSKYKYSLSIFALGLGIKCFEKHLTKSKKLNLIDSISAIDPIEFKEYVKSLNDHYSSLGSKTIKLTKSEKIYRNSSLTVIYTKKIIKKNQIISYKDLTHKRPLKFSNNFFVDPDKILGRVANCDINIDEPIKRTQIK